MTATGLRSQIIVAEWGGLPIVSVCPRKTVLGANMKRRDFLQAAGLTLALPALESLGGAANLETASVAKRLLLMTDGYGFYTPTFYPKSTGSEWESNEVTKSLEPLRS